MHNSNLRSSSNSDTDQVGHVLKITFRKSFGTINRINPDGNVFCAVLIFESTRCQIA